jgi:hypothetical protein
MNKRMAVLTMGVAAAVLAGGGAAVAAVTATGPVDGNNVVHGCYTNAELNGSHALVLQDAGTSCPKGTTAVQWNEQGQPGATGQTGATGAQGPAGISVGVSGSSNTELAMLSPAAYEPVMTSPAVPQAGDYYINATVSGLVDGPDVLNCGFGEDPGVVQADSESYETVSLVGDVELSAGEPVTIFCASGDGVTGTEFLWGYVTATLINSSNAAVGSTAAQGAASSDARRAPAASRWVNKPPAIIIKPRAVHKRRARHKH